MLDFTPGTVDPENRTVEDFKGNKIRFDLLAIIPPHVGSGFLENSEGVGDAAGWVPCDKNSLRHRKIDNIYAIGDTGNFPSAKTPQGRESRSKFWHSG